jgi:hypothetical protein
MRHQDQTWRQLAARNPDAGLWSIRAMLMLVLGCSAAFWVVAAVLWRM